MQLFFTTAGAAALNNAISTNTPLVIDNFKFGEDADYTPDPASSEPMPYSVYQGSSTNMRHWKMASNDLAIICLIPADVGNLTIGNVMLYAGSLAVCAAILKQPYVKQKTGGAIRAGNFLSVVFGMQSAADKDLAAGLDLTGLAGAYAAAENVNTERDMKHAGLSRTSINRVQNVVLSDRPAIAFKSGASTPDQWIAVPLFSLAEVAANTASGGVSGDNYA